NLEAGVETACVPVDSQVPVQLLDEEVELLRLRHLDLRMQAEVVVEAGRPALQPADDDQVRQLGAAFAGAPEAAAAVGVVGPGGPPAHRLGGRMVGGAGGCLGGLGL